MNPLIPVAIIAAVMFSAKNLKDKIQRISVTGFSIKPGKISLAEVVLNVTLKVYNPNTQAVPFGYFQGYVYRGGTRLGRIMYDEKAAGNVKTFPGKAETPATFQVVISGLGIVANLYNIIRNLRNSKAVDTTLTVDGVLNIGGFDVPVKFSYDLRNAIGGIGKPYVKMEFNSNDEMQKHFLKDCGGAVPKFSLNGLSGIDKQYNVFRIYPVKATAARGKKVKISSERYKETKYIDRNDQSGDIQDNAAAWLEKKGFHIIGGGKGKDHYYIISDTFKSIKA